MNNSFRFRSIVLFLFVMQLGFAYAQSAEAEIKRWVQTENKKCPIDGNNGQIITKLTYQNKILEFHITYNNLICDYASVKSNKIADFKLLMLKMLLLNDTGKSVISNLARISGSLIYHYYSSSSDDKIDYAFTPSEIKSAYKNYSQLSDELQYLNIQIESSNMILPQEAGEGLIYNKVYVADSAIVMEFIVDETKQDFSYYLQNRNLLKLQVMDDIKSIISTYGNFKKTFKICSQNNKSIRYRYVGKSTNNIVEINVLPSEINKILNSVK